MLSESKQCYSMHIISYFSLYWRFTTLEQVSLFIYDSSKSKNGNEILLMQHDTYMVRIYTCDDKIYTCGIVHSLGT